jgi:ABC-type antimicrobial peptide transport system permease subunit
MPQPPAAQLFVRLAPNAGLPASQLYDVVSQTDPTLRLSEVGTAADAWGPVHAGGRVGATVVVALGAIVLMLSMAGVYALMSFTVSQRTREIAIRTAVGAPRGRILRSVFGKAALQIAAGVALGSVLAAPALRSDLANDGLRSLVIVAALLIGAGVAACLVPVRRALSIEPAAAIKAE